MSTKGKISVASWDHDTPYINLDLDDPAVERALQRFGGSTLLRISVISGGKTISVFVSARVSGDIRAGATNGVHMRMSVVRKNTDVVRVAHAVPWQDLTPGRDYDAT